MADQTERLRIIIEADGTATLSDGTRLAADQVRKLGEELSRTGQQVENTGTRSEKAGRHIAGMGRDIAQGDWRGAAVNMGRLAMSTGAMEVAASAAGVAIGIGAVALVGLAVAAKQAHDETQRQANAMLLTGNYAGLVSGQLNEMARQTAAGINGSVGNTRETMEALVASGRVTRQTLGEMAGAVELVTQYSGRSRESVVKDFTGMADGVAKWAVEHNKSYHFITFEQYKYIESLEKAGRSQEAMRVTSEALSQHLGGDLTRNLGTLQKAWQGVRNWASQAWDAMLNVGREDTLEQKLQKLRERLEKEVNPVTPAGRTAKPANRQLVNELQVEIDTTEGLIRLQRMAAEQKSQMAQEAEAAIAKDREKDKKGPKDTTYERLNQQIERKLVLARAEEEQGKKLTESERYRLDMLEQIADTETKIGPARANQLRLLVDETAEVMRNNEARADLIKTRQKNEEMADKQLATQERELAALMASNASLVDQIAQVGLTTEQLARLRVERIEGLIVAERENLVMAQNVEGNEAQVQLIARRIALLERERDLTRQLGVAQVNDEQRRKNEAESKKFSEDLRRDLTRSLQRAFESGKDPAAALADTLANTIKTRVTRAMAEALLNPILKPLEQSLSGLSGGFGGLFNGGPSTFTNDSGGTELAGSLGFAKGGAFRSASLSAYSGGVYNTPQTFAFAKGAGVFAEAGPEAIMPLKRGANGSLGVVAHGGMGSGELTMNVTVINNTGSQVSVRQRPGGNGMDMELVLDAVDSGMADRISAGAGSTARALEGRYGLRTAVN